MENLYLLYGASASLAIEAEARRPVDEGGLGIDGFELMGRAAIFALECLYQRWPDAPGFSLFCGKGNNAGDGYLMAVKAKQLGMNVQIFAVTEPTDLVGDARRAYESCKNIGLLPDQPDAPIRYPLVVDALLGTGFYPPLRDDVSHAISRINDHKCQVLSLDLPSGVSADFGIGNTDSCINAALTVTFITRKIGLYTGAATSVAGEIVYSDLGVPARIFARYASIPRLRWSPERLRVPLVNAYKSQRGHVLIVGGDHGMGGAALMSAEAAFRAGAGLVTVATREEHRSGILARLPEAMWIDPHSAGFDRLASNCDCIVVGPGLGRENWGLEVFKRTLPIAANKIFDADALYWLAVEEDLRTLYQDSLGRHFITPHSAEAARLLGCTPQHIESDRIYSASALALDFACSGVLKGPGSVIFDERSTAICGQGNAGMATAGMGDVLSGVAGSLVAEASTQDNCNMPALDYAFQTAVLWHSAAADLASIERGTRGLMARDVISYLSSVAIKKN